MCYGPEKRAGRSESGSNVSYGKLQVMVQFCVPEGVLLTAGRRSEVCVHASRRFPSVAQRSASLYALDTGFNGLTAETVSPCPFH
jgi:hypothetical protein